MTQTVDRGTERPAVSDAPPPSASSSPTPTWAGRLVTVPGGGRARLGAAVLAVLVALGAAGHLVVDRITALPSGAALRVGDQTISETELGQRIDLLAALYAVKPPTDAAGHDRFQRDAAQAVAATTVIEQQARQEQVVVPEAQVRDAVTKLADAFPQGRAGFDAAVARLRLSQEAVSDEIRRQMTAGALQSKVTADSPPVTDADVQQAYDTRRELSTVPEQRHLRNIVVNDQQKAQQIADQARGGADFAVLAGQNSVDGATAQTGGDLGTVSRDQLEKPVGDAAYGVPSAAVYGPVETAGHWNVGQVLEVTPERRLPLDQVRDGLRAKLDDERHQQRWQAWVGERFAQADITYADDYRPAHPDVLPASPGTP